MLFSFLQQGFVSRKRRNTQVFASFNKKPGFVYLFQEKKGLFQEQEGLPLAACFKNRCSSACFKNRSKKKEQVFVSFKRTGVLLFKKKKKNRCCSTTNKVFFFFVR